MKKIDPKIEDKIVQEYLGSDDGGNSLAGRYGIGSTTLYRILQRKGVPIDDRKRFRGLTHRERLTQEQMKLACEDYQNGITISELASRYACDPQTVRRVLRMNNIQIRLGRSTRVWTDEDKNELLRLADEGMSQCKIAKQFGVGQTNISRRMRANGIKVKIKAVTGERHGNWKGGQIKTSGGYIMELLPEDSQFLAMANSSQYAMQHRLVMAQHLGRPLAENETVHHINGKRADNRIENLELRTGKHGKGTVLVCADCGSKNIITMKLDAEA